MTGSQRLAALTDRLLLTDRRTHTIQLSVLSPLLAVILSLIYSLQTVSPAQHLRDQVSDRPVSEVRLVLETSRRTYRAHALVGIVAYLENASRQPYYVGNRLGNLLTILPYHYIELRIKDHYGNEVWVGRGAEAGVEITGQTPENKITEDYTLLRPGGIHGVRQVLQLKLRPGRYQLQANYHEFEALRWTEAERSKLPAPVWTIPIISNTVSIIVTR
jgi:hypothetical protein